MLFTRLFYADLKSRGKEQPDTFVVFKIIEQEKTQRLNLL